MRIHLISDLHLDHDAEADAEFIRNLQPQPGIDVLVLAGDWFSVSRPQETETLFKRLLDCYPDVVVVPGNHDYWRASPGEAEAAMRPPGAMDRLHVLTTSSPTTVINGQTFIGGAMWYPEPNPRLSQSFIDMRQIKTTKSWFFDQFKALKALLEASDLTRAVVVTHHLPHPNSTPVKFRGSPTDHFFMTNMTDLIMKKEPMLWLHGHTHDACDYKVSKTRIVCNPRGYPFEYTARAPYEPKLIEI